MTVQTSVSELRKKCHAVFFFKKKNCFFSLHEYRDTIYSHGGSAAKPCVSRLAVLVKGSPSLTVCHRPLHDPTKSQPALKGISQVALNPKHCVRAQTTADRMLPLLS